MRTTERMDVRRHFLTNETAIHLDKQIDAVLLEMQQVGVTSEEYPKLMAYLERLTEVKKLQSRAPVSSDTIAQVVGSLVGILVIVVYEQKHVLQSRGFSLLPRTKA